MSVHGEHAGAARRLRENRMRSILAPRADGGRDGHGHGVALLVRCPTLTDHSHQDPGEGERDALHGRVPGDPPLSSLSSSASTKKSPAVCGQGRSRTLCRRSGCSGTLWSTGSRRASMLRCRRGETSWWRRSGTSICTSLSRLSKCPRSRVRPVVLAWCSRCRRRREVPTDPGYALGVLASKGFSRRELRGILSGQVQQRQMPSSSLMFQFHLEIFKVLSQDSALFSRTLTFQFSLVVGEGERRSSRCWFKAEFNSIGRGAEHVDIPVPRGGGLHEHDRVGVGWFPRDSAGPRLQVCTYFQLALL